MSFDFIFNIHTSVFRSALIFEVKRLVMLTRHSEKKFLSFLQNELSLSKADIAVALRQRELDNGPLPMLLWRYGLISIEQLARIFDWLEDQI
jgi:Protein of unknown function (DUF2949)